jgi:hypothetical protein
MKLKIMLKEKVRMVDGGKYNQLQKKENNKE